MRLNKQKMSVLRVLFLLLIETNKYAWKYYLRSSDKTEKGLTNCAGSFLTTALGTAKTPIKMNREE